MVLQSGFGMGGWSHEWVMLIHMKGVLSLFGGLSLSEPSPSSNVGSYQPIGQQEADQAEQYKDRHPSVEIHRTYHDEVVCKSEGDTRRNQSHAIREFL